MRQFTDHKGRLWDVEINVTTLKRVRDLAKVDLTKILDDGGLERFLDDAFAKGDALYAICRDQAKAAAIDDEDFGRGLAGAAMLAAETAILEELADFFPLRRTLIEKTAERHRTWRATADDRILAYMSNPATEKRILSRVDEILASHGARQLGGISGNAPESSE